jgi:hypothetical protein
VSDHKGAHDLLNQLPRAGTLIPIAAMTATGFAMSLPHGALHRASQAGKTESRPSIMTRHSTNSPTKSRTSLPSFKDWRRIATRYDRCAHTFLSAINIAASVAFYLKE